MHGPLNAKFNNVILYYNLSLYLIIKSEQNLDVWLKNYKNVLWFTFCSTLSEIFSNINIEIVFECNGVKREGFSPARNILQALLPA